MCNNGKALSQAFELTGVSYKLLYQRDGYFRSELKVYFSFDKRNRNYSILYVNGTAEG